MAGWWLSHPSEKYESVGIIIPNGKTKFCSKPPISTSIYITIWKDPPFYSWVNQLFRLGHGFKFANCKRLPEGTNSYKLVQDFTGPSTVSIHQPRNDLGDQHRSREIPNDQSKQPNQTGRMETRWWVSAKDFKIYELSWVYEHRSNHCFAIKTLTYEMKYHEMPFEGLVFSENSAWNSGFNIG